TTASTPTAAPAAPTHAARHPHPCRPQPRRPSPRSLPPTAPSPSAATPTATPPQPPVTPSPGNAHDRGRAAGRRAPPAAPRPTRGPGRHLAAVLTRRRG